MLSPTVHLPVATVAIAAGVVIAACGSTSPTSSGSAIQAAQTGASQDGVAFSGCMRSHGVTDFPDPGTPGFKFALAPSTAKSPAFGPAFAACRHLLPHDGAPGQEAAHSPADIAAFLAFARCLRSHGFPNFPDPTPTGELTHEMLAQAGIDLHQPAVVQAADACVGVTHGFITKADVARFVAGQ